MFFNRNAAKFKRLNASEFNALKANGASPYLLDVRQPFELTAFGAIPGVVNIPLGDLRSRMNELPGDKEQMIVVICQSGNRSQNAAKMLTDAGYSNVHNLDGGTMGWLRTR